MWLSALEKADGVALVFSLTSKSSFERVSKFRELVIRVKGEPLSIPISSQRSIQLTHVTHPPGEEFPLILIGTKLDLSWRQVTKSSAASKAREWSVPYYEVSSLTGLRIRDSLGKMCELVLARRVAFASTSIRTHICVYLRDTLFLVDAAAHSLVRNSLCAYEGADY